MGLSELSKARIKGVAWRVIPSRFPPVDLFREIAPRKDWPYLNDLEGMTNERLRAESLSDGLIRAEDRVEQSSSHYITGPLSHPRLEGSQFSDGTFGVLYAALDFDTIVAEVKLAREAFLRSTDEPATRIDMRCIVLDIDGELHDIRGAKGDQYRGANAKESRELGRCLRDAGAWGIVFDSVARPGGTCVAVFRPPVLKNARQERHFAFIWDGRRIADIYTYSKAG